MYIVFFFIFPYYSLHWHFYSSRINTTILTLFIFIPFVAKVPIFGWFPQTCLESGVSRRSLKAARRGRSRGSAAVTKLTLLSRS